MANWPNWIDGHCHLADSRLEETIAEVIQRSLTAGITRFLQGGTDPLDWDRQLSLQARYPAQILPVFGIYPPWVNTANAQDLEAACARLKRLLPQSCALGEIGLDFRRLKEPELRKRQVESFERQLALAHDHGLPVILHIVHAQPEALRVLKKSSFRQGGIVHSFSGNLKQAQAYIDLGFAISVGCGVLAHSAGSLRETLKNIPSESIVVESDAPDQPPRHDAGILNEPTAILVTATEIAKLRSSTPEETLDRSSANLRRIFRLNS